MVRIGTSEYLKRFLKTNLDTRTSARLESSFHACYLLNIQSKTKQADEKYSSTSTIASA